MPESYSNSDKDASMRRLVSEIGVQPNVNAMIESKLLSGMTCNSVRAWLILSGLPHRTVESLPTSSLCKAYNFPAYRAGILKRIAEGKGPRQRLSIDDITADAPPARASIPATTVASPAESGLSVSAVESIAWKQADKYATEILVNEINDQISVRVPTIIESKLKAFQPALSDSVRQQIVALSREAAIAEIEKNKTPREILINNVQSGAAKNIGVQHSQFDKLLRACQAKTSSGHRLNIWLTGPAGSGKSTAAVNVAKALNLAFAFDGSLDADYKVLGYRDASGKFHSTEFLRVYEYGGIYLADEIDGWTPSATIALNAALANGIVSTVDGLKKRHPDFICIAAANTWGHGATSEYVGRTKQDAATLDRFQPKIDWQIDEDLELAVSPNETWTRFVQKTRAAVKRNGLKILVTPRASIFGGSLLAAGFTWQETVEMTLAAGISPEQASMIGLTP